MFKCIRKLACGWPAWHCLTPEADMSYQRYTDTLTVLAMAQTTQTCLCGSRDDMQFVCNAPTTHTPPPPTIPAKVGVSGVVRHLKQVLPLVKHASFHYTRHPRMLHFTPSPLHFIIRKHRDEEGGRRERERQWKYINKTLFYLNLHGTSSFLTANICSPISMLIAEFFFSPLSPSFPVFLSRSLCLSLFFSWGLCLNKIFCQIFSQNTAKLTSLWQRWLHVLRRQPFESTHSMWSRDPIVLWCHHQQVKKKLHLSSFYWLTTKLFFPWGSQIIKAFTPKPLSYIVKRKSNLEYSAVFPKWASPNWPHIEGHR